MPYAKQFPNDLEVSASDDEWTSIVCLGVGLVGQIVQPDDAKFIVKACNAHDQLVTALKEARRAIGDHNAPSDCYATGPMTGDSIRDLVQCPACSAIAMYDEAIAKATAP